MSINMKNINVFRRLDELETANLHLQVMLKNVRYDIDNLKNAAQVHHEHLVALTPKPKAKPGPKPKPKAIKTKAALEKAMEKKRAYAKAYYAKKQAEKAAA